MRPHIYNLAGISLGLFAIALPHPALRAASTTQSGTNGPIGTLNVNPLYASASTAISASDSSAQAKQDAFSVLEVIQADWKNYLSINNTGTIVQPITNTYSMGATTGTAILFKEHWRKKPTGGGILIDSISQPSDSSETNAVDPISLQKALGEGGMDHMENTINAIAPPEPDFFSNQSLDFTITWPDNRPPTVSMSGDGVISAGGQSNSLQSNKGNVITFSFSASDPDSNYQRTLLWVRVDGIGNWQEIYNSTAPGGAFSYALNAIGSYEFHCRALDLMGLESETAIINVNCPNRAPTIAWENLVASFEYGQSVVIRARAQDADDNLAAIHMNLNGNPHRHDGFSGGLTGNASNAYLDSYPISPDTGTYIYTAIAWDNWVASSQIAHAVTFVKATPYAASGVFSDQSIAEGTTLATTHLSARFTNPYNGNLTAPGAVVYTILSGGNASHPNGIVIAAGTVLPSGTYTICATLASSQNYNEAVAHAQFVVEANPNADNDGDGLSNAVETALGLNPNSQATESPALLDVNIHTPTSENQ